MRRRARGPESARWWKRPACWRRGHLPTYGWGPYRTRAGLHVYSIICQRCGHETDRPRFAKALHRHGRCVEGTRLELGIRWRQMRAEVADALGVEGRAIMAAASQIPHRFLWDEDVVGVTPGSETAPGDASPEPM